MRVLGCAVILVACSDGGVVVKVDPAGVAVDEVRLFVGVGDGSSSQLQPPGIGDSGSDRMYWERDPNNAGDHSAAATARFVLANDGSSGSLPAMIAVGYQNGQPVAAASRLDFSVPVSDFEVYTLTLSPPVPDLFAFQVWSPDANAAATEASCVGLEDRRTTPLYPSGFIVTGNDRDCDGIADTDPLECDPDVYHASRPPERGDLTCTTAASGQCFLGGPGCTDGMPHDASACNPSSYCASPRLCEVCSGIACASDITPLIPDTAPVHLACTVPLATDGTPCGPIALPQFFQGANCTDIAIRGSDGTFGSELDTGGLHLALQHTGCAITLAPTGTIAPQHRADIGGLLAFDLDNGHQLAIPVELAASSTGCDTTPVCGIVSSAASSADLSNLLTCAGL